MLLCFVCLGFFFLVWGKLDCQYIKGYFLIFFFTVSKQNVHSFSCSTSVASSSFSCSIQLPVEFLVAGFCEIKALKANFLSVWPSNTKKALCNSRPLC